jgi:hypothetical protein
VSKFTTDPIVWLDQAYQGLMDHVPKNEQKGQVYLLIVNPEKRQWSGGVFPGVKTINKKT